MDCIVRSARADEAPLLAHLHRRSALVGFAHIFPPDAPPPTHEHLLRRWGEWLGADHQRSGGVLVADAGAGPVGVALAGPDPTDPVTGHLSRLYVEPALWGRGLGRRLHDAAIDLLVQKRFTDATLWVLEGNQRARSWFERLGWRPTGERKVTYAPASIDDLRYRRPLDRAPDPRGP